MQAEYYKNGIKVSGDTRPWYNYLKQMGGTWNSNLEGGGGWIFGKNREAELMQMIGQANAGVIAQSPKEQQAAVVTPNRVLIQQPFIQQPLVQQQPRLQIAPQPTIMGAPAMPRVIFPGQVEAPRSPLIQAPAPQQFNLPVLPTVVQAPVAQPVHFANRFQAADELTYQIILYTVPLPHVGQKVTLSYGETTADYTVTTVKDTAPVDEFWITKDEQISHVVLLSGKWQINLMAVEHTIIFHK